MIETREGREPGLGDSARQAVGFGYAKVTPLQLSAIAGTFANGGKRAVPRLFLDRDAAEPEKIVEIDPALLETVRKSMWRGVNEPGGVSPLAKSDDIAIAGAPGTDGISRDKREKAGHFVAFAPYNTPRYAIAVTVENARSGSAVCAPLAKIILERFEEIDAGKKVEVTPLAPAKAHDREIATVE